MTTPTLQTRREFLRKTLLGSALTWTLPAFLQATIQSLHAETLDRATQSATGRDHPILVVIQLAGGNDGLNTVIPVGNDFYYKARPQLAVPREKVLSLTGDVGLHPSLAPLKSLYEEGHLGVVLGAGYPNPNRSHFRSTEIWQTASDADRTLSQGWLGRYFDNQCRGEAADVGVAIAAETPQAFQCTSSHGIAFRNPEQFKLTGSSFSAGGSDPEDLLFRKMNRMDDSEGDNAGASVGSVGGAARPQPGERPIDFLQRTALDAQVSSDRIRAIVAKYHSAATYPAGRLAQELKLVGQLIGGGLSSRVYYLSHGGFDTHNNQTGTHERLLGEFASALKAFVDDLQAQGHLDRVAIMTFSEFGRRVQENASRGTDHGTAAPMFLAGGRLRAGIQGQMPSLDPKQLDRGDLRHTVDFRSVYASVLEQHLRTPGAPILGRAFPQLPLFGG